MPQSAGTGAQMSSGCGYVQAMVDQRPVYDNRRKKTMAKKKKKKRGGY